ncbi:cation diffusion facilitator family transporter, partial [Citrobacter portucalensis]|uniref:cation diffusion facilitator family transporter n=1 Tax=Citrobacter portucalensis TaxID=1639133 RepID=UPI00226BAFF7
IKLVLILTFSYAIIQSIGGVLSGSLALIADAGHMFSDAAALLLAFIAYRIARKPATGRFTFGFHRVRVLAALANGVTLIALVIWIIWLAVERITQPPEILTGPMLVVAVIGLLVNVAGAWILYDRNSNDGNLKGAFLHVIGDLLGSLGAITAAIGIMLTGWTILDPLISVFVAMLVVRSAWQLIISSTDIILQAAPVGITTDVVKKDLLAIPEIAETGHVHVWILADKSVIATVHVTPVTWIDPLRLPQIVSKRLRENFSFSHVTVQVDPPGQLHMQENLDE